MGDTQERDSKERAPNSDTSGDADGVHVDGSHGSRWQGLIARESSGEADQVSALGSLGLNGVEHFPTRYNRREQKPR